MKARLVVMFASILSLAACPSSKPAPDDTKTTNADAAKGFRFGWRAGDSFDLVYAKQRKGETLEVTTRGTVRAGADAGQLRVAFEPVVLAAKDQKLAAATGTHAFIDVWPDLVVDARTGELIGIEGDLTAPQKDAIAARWATLVALVGFDLEVGKQRSYTSEVEAGEGLLLPVKITERYSETAELGDRVELSRAYEGDTVKKLWRVMLADSGAPKSAVDAVQAASREEKLMVQTDARTLRHLRIEDSSTFTVTTLDKKKAERVDLYTESESWVFTWSR